jgi:putative alpha-1,2-mannosidase
MGLLLDSLFTLSTPLRGTQISPDITGMVGQYAQGNEPGHHVPYLYNYIGQPLRTRQICDTILQHLYTDAPDGLCGNEDCGQLSAWYVLSAVGLYQVCPGRPVWTMGSPLFHVARLHLPGAKEPLTVLQTAPQPSRRGKTLWRWCGHRLRRPFLRHKLLSQGGILEVMAYPEQKR